MEAQQTRLDVTSNNIANVTTPGFKKSRAAFEDLYYQTLRSTGSSSTQGSPIGLQVAASSPEELAARVKVEAAKWSKAMSEAGIEAE
jgi:flagellar basal-body rod protein FlgG